MQYRSLLGYYNFGTCLRYLQDCQAVFPAHGDQYVLGNLTAFFKNLDTLGMPVTKRVAEEYLNDLAAKLEEYGNDDTVGDEVADELRDAMHTVRVTLEAELEGIGAYSPTPKRIDLQKLLDDVGALFAPGIYIALPEIAKYDFREAGKCIAFELPTGAAFHILRATEDVLRYYYRQMVRQKRIASMNWGPIVLDLRRRTRTKNYDVLNNHLDNIRDSFRNPTQHPDAKYDIHEVQDLWSVCVDVVNRMIRTLVKEGRT